MAPSSRKSLRDIAKRWTANGLSVVPIRPDGSKAPSVNWTKLQHRILSDEEIDKEFSKGYGIAVIGGQISGNLEMLDFDVPTDKDTGKVFGPCVFDEWYDQLDIDLLELVEQMPRVQTPSGGIHLYYRCEALEGNAKLARQLFKEYTDANGNEKPLTVIETRGEGGYVIAPHSPAKCHPSGKTYEFITGDFESIPVITPEQRQELFEVCRGFDESKIEDKKLEASQRKAPIPRADGRLRPGDDFDRRASWDEILEPLGWTFVFRRRDGSLLWRRPGKNKGISATIRPYTPPDSNEEKEYFYNFSANGDPFPEETALTKFQAYTIAYHNGDFEAAARELGRQGFGEAPSAPSAIQDLDVIIDAKRPDAVPWGDLDPGLTTRVEELELEAQAAEREDAPPKIEFPADVPVGASIFEEPMDPLEVQINEDEEKILSIEKAQKEKKRKAKRKAELSKGPAYLVWRDFGEPPQRQMTKDGRIKTLVTRPRDTIWHTLNDKFSKDGLRTLHHQNQMFMMWDGTKYRQYKEDDIRPIISNYLTYFAEMDGFDDDDKAMWKPYEVRKHKVLELAMTLKDMTHIDSSLSDPSWLIDDDEDLPDPREIVSCKNGLLDIANRELLPPTPGFYSFTNTNITYDPDAKEPENWLKFLDTTLDAESRDLLQEWFGYCLVQDTRMQKIMMIVGKPGSGKGTAVRVLQKLVGHGSYCSMDFEKLGDQFALSVALGKSLMIFPDARQNFGSQNKGNVVSSLLSISGEDDILIDRKRIDPVTQKLNTRITIVSNDVLSLPDTSGALERRQLWIRFPGFESEADPDLKKKLDAELTGILNWAIEGWHRVRNSGEFTEPESAQDFRDSFREQSSPIKAFIEDTCRVERGKSQLVGEIYHMWNLWRKIKGYSNTHSAAAFGKQLISADMIIRKTRIRKDGKRVWAYDNITLDSDKVAEFIADTVGEERWEKIKDEYMKKSEDDVIDIFEWSRQNKAKE